ncbi:hypothetical protein Tco_0059967 [Tanacetum coccineum]
MYETFSASSSESLDSIFNRLQKIVSQLTILVEIDTLGELNHKCLKKSPTDECCHQYYAYLATQPNGSQVVHAMKVIMAGYYKKKVNVSKCHKLGYFARREHEILNQLEQKQEFKQLIEDSEKWKKLLPKHVQNNKTCSKTTSKNYEDLKTQYDKLRVEFRKSESDLSNYKRGLASVEERLVFYKKNESMLNDQIDVLKRDAS